MSSLKLLMMVPSFLTAHAFDASRNGLRDSGFAWVVYNYAGNVDLRRRLSLAHNVTHSSFRDLRIHRKSA